MECQESGGIWECAAREQQQRSQEYNVAHTSSIQQQRHAHKSRTPQTAHIHSQKET